MANKKEDITRGEFFFGDIKHIEKCKKNKNKENE